jgi:hypothetical protein
MTALENREIAKQNIAAVLLVRWPYCPLPPARQHKLDSRRAQRGWRQSSALAIDQARPCDAEIVNVLAQMSELCQVIMAVILVVFPRRVRFGGVIGPAIVAGLLTSLRRCRRLDRSTLLEYQVNVGLHMNGEARWFGSGSGGRSGDTVEDSTASRSRVAAAGGTSATGRQHGWQWSRRLVPGRSKALYVGASNSYFRSLGLPSLFENY